MPGVLVPYSLSKQGYNNNINLVVVNANYHWFSMILTKNSWTYTRTVSTGSSSVLQPPRLRQTSVFASALFWFMRHLIWLA